MGNSQLFHCSCTSRCYCPYSDMSISIEKIFSIPSRISATSCMTFSRARPRYVANLSRWIYDGSHGNHPEKIIHQHESTVQRDDILWPCNRAHFADTTACNVSVFPWHKRQRYDEYADAG